MLMLDGKSNQVVIWFVFGTRLTPAMLAHMIYDLQEPILVLLQGQ